MQTHDLKKQYPILFKTSNYLQNKAFFFKNSLPKLLSSNKYNFQRAENCCEIALKLSSGNWDEYFKKVDILIDLSFDFLKLQLQLEKNGRYSFSTLEEVEKNVYHDSDGPNYLWGLYFSEFFWEVHINLVDFFIDEFASKNQKTGNILEVPVGSGFFLSQFLTKNPEWKGVGIDFAESATNLSSAILHENNIPEKSYQIIKEDFLNFQTNKKFDKIICGEFLEHVESPLTILKKLNNLLNHNGEVFVTAAIWSGGVDHIFLYTNAQEVRNHIEEADFQIVKELVQPVFEKDKNNTEKSKIPINYAAIIKKSV